MVKEYIVNYGLNDHCVQQLEKEILQRYNDTSYYQSDCDFLLSLRKDIINKQMLTHQEKLLPDLIAFNDVLRDALHDMYVRAHRIWNKMVLNIEDTDGEEMELTAKCYLDYTYPRLHPVQGNDRQDLWDALCDGDLNPPVPSPLGSPPWMTKPGITRWKIRPS